MRQRFLRTLPLAGSRPALLRNAAALLLLGPLAQASLAANPEAAPAVPVTEEPITKFDRDHWSFRPLSRPNVPTVTKTDWPRTPIDGFILARLEEDGLTPLPDTDRVTLIRRLTFDLTGLPPTPAEIDAFLADPSPDAYEKLVDRLLASPAYGERWAQHWLDLARFAETDGFEFDHIRPNAWRYRDWVIEALNQDLPIDEFIRFQLAGDELRPDDPQAAVATGFLLCGPDMPDINLQEERRHTFLNDMAATVGSVFLGLQMGCAQCHDHKYDPVSQLDFYRFRAFFEHDNLFREHPIPTAEQRAARKAFERRRADDWKRLLEEIAALEAAALDRLRQEQDAPKLKLSDRELAERFTEEERRRHQELTAQLDKVKKQKPPAFPMGRVMREPGPEIPASYLQIRGDFRRRGPRVEAAFPRVINPDHEIVPLPDANDSSSGRRAALAMWLTDPAHPLTTRIFVNRIWQHHFGHGLTRSPSDVGLMGESPSHPELLDWLATELPRQGWSLKSLHRLIVTSSTYRQASRPTTSHWNERQRAAARTSWEQSTAADPENRLLARMPRRRLEGEAIRDAMLAAADNLSQRRGGPGIRPPLPHELVHTLLKNQWPVTKNIEDHRRRSIYLFVRRNLRFPLFEVFDRPDTNASCARRNQSTIAPQALTLWNSELSLSTARDLSGYLMEQCCSDRREQIELCYRRTLARRPTPDERSLAERFLEEGAERLRAEGRPLEELAVPDSLPANADPYEVAALTDLCLTLFNVNEFLYID